MCRGGKSLCALSAGDGREPLVVMELLFSLRAGIGVGVRADDTGIGRIASRGRVCGAGRERGRDEIPSRSMCSTNLEPVSITLSLSSNPGSRL